MQRLSINPVMYRLLNHSGVTVSQFVNLTSRYIVLFTNSIEDLMFCIIYQIDNLFYFYHLLLKNSSWINVMVKISAK